MNHSTTGTPITAPSDGVRSSQRRRGWLAQEWLALLDTFPAASKSRVSRGRAMAKSGRLRDLWFSPGIANAEVVERDPLRISLRVRVFGADDWERVVAHLRARLDFVAALLEGHLPRDLVDDLAADGLALIPTASDFESSCGCDDYLSPCAHTAALHVLLADALDGDPFLLLTLRGRPRGQVLAALRRAWGDPKPLVPPKEATHEPPPAADSWFDAPTPLPTLEFKPCFDPAGPPVGLRELGPAPDGEDLERVLGPLYQAGAALAEAVALAEEPDQPDRAFMSATTNAAPRRLSSPHGAAKLSFTPPPEPATATEEDDVTAAILELLTDRAGHRGRDIAHNLGVALPTTRRKLRALEIRGAIHRTGKTRGTEWWLS